ncbi:uncharacterized protein RJT21DRAFT_111363 [Scheffersomyces amazonensis]|uniref:uncharacterized protein n=1 Tax=Scheffersomyces amazonensis TaxID=1078765 RepID=UPI00315CA6F4
MCAGTISLDTTTDSETIFGSYLEPSIDILKRLHRVRGEVRHDIEMEEPVAESNRQMVQRTPSPTQTTTEVLKRSGRIRTPRKRDIYEAPERSRKRTTKSQTTKSQTTKSKPKSTRTRMTIRADAGGVEMTASGTETEGATAENIRPISTISQATNREYADAVEVTASVPEGAAENIRPTPTLVSNEMLYDQGRVLQEILQDQGRVLQGILQDQGRVLQGTLQGILEAINRLNNTMTH